MFSSASMYRRVLARLAVALALGCAVVSAGCSPWYFERPATVKAAVPLQKDAPKLSGTLPPLPKDMGRVVFGCIDHQCKVTEELVREQFSASAVGGGFARGDGSKTRVLCTETPCWADLSYGPHAIRIESTDLESCQGPGFLEFKRDGYCSSNPTEITATATTRPVVVLVRPKIEHHVPRKSLREIFPEAHLTFEVEDGSYGN